MSLLETEALTAFYGDFQALFGIDLRVEPGEVVAIIGANGAGKSTFLKAVTGQLPTPPEAVRFDGAAIGGLPTHAIVAQGIALVPEGRRLFPSLTIEENLLMGRYVRRPGPWELARVFELFGVLQRYRRRPGTALSGGEQQMAAIGRALMANPRLLLCDEISLGLAPTIVKDLYGALATVREQGTAVLLVEQDIGQAMRVADRVYCFQEGRVSLHGVPGELTRDRVRDAYFGMSGM